MRRYSDTPKDRYRRQMLLERIEAQGLDVNDYPNLFDYPERNEKLAAIKQRKAAKKAKIMNNNDKSTLMDKLVLDDIEPITDTQDLIFGEFSGKDRHMALLGCPGTGKTFLALYRAFRAVFIEKTQKKVIVVRSQVQTRDVGYMPGKNDEKLGVYEHAYINLVNDLFKSPHAYTLLKQQGVLEFTSTSFLRGLTYDDTVVVVDECQSMNFHELSTIITRIGENSKVYFCGDFEQDDLIKNKYDQSGLRKFVKILKNMRSFVIFSMTEDDIVRSGLVREFIVAQRQHEEDD